MKKTKIISKLLLLGMCVSLCAGVTTVNPVNAFADTASVTWTQDAQGENVVVNNITFRKTSANTVALSNINDAVTKLEIPATITVNGQVYNVDSIDEHACEHKPNLQEVYIPKTIKKIAGWTMGYNKSLTKVVFDKDSPIEALPSGIFAVDQNLSTVVLPTGLKRIKSFAFNSCQTLGMTTDSQGKKVGNFKVPYGVEIIDSYAFACMVKGSQINQEADKDYLDPEVGCDRFNITLPPTVECIGVGAFNLSKNQIYITLRGYSVKTPGGTSFTDYRNLMYSGAGITDTQDPNDVKVTIVDFNDSTMPESEKVY